MQLLGNKTLAFQLSSKRSIGKLDPLRIFMRFKISLWHFLITDKVLTSDAHLWTRNNDTNEHGIVSSSSFHRLIETARKVARGVLDHFNEGNEPIFNITGKLAFNRSNDVTISNLQKSTSHLTYITNTRRTSNYFFPQKLIVRLISRYA